jgi:polyphosphate kinase
LGGNPEGAQIDEGLKAYLADNQDAWELDAQGKWSKVKPRGGARRRSAQGELLEKMRATDDDV